MKTSRKEKQNIPEGWKSGKLLGCFDVPSKLPGLKLSEYEKEGEYPVFDQGQSYVSGYSSHKSLVVENTPTILFGDHTRIVKFIETPFVPGADGTKILWAKDDFDSRYLYYALFNAPVPNTGYNRHFKFLKDKELVYPESKKEQQKIAEVLGAVDEEIEKTKEVIKATERLKKGLMQKLFIQGIGHKKFKQTELGEIPETWQVKTLQEMLDEGIIIGHLDGNHGELYPKSSEFVEEGVPYLSANCIEEGVLSLKKAKYLNRERAEKFVKGVAKDGDVLFAHNATVGPVTKLYINQDYVILSTTLTYYRTDESKLLSDYLAYYMQSSLFVNQYKKVMSQTTRNQVPITMQRKFFHVLPPQTEQKQIAEILSAVDEKILVNKKLLAKQTALKKGLMQDLLRGVKRVRV